MKEQWQELKETIIEMRDNNEFEYEDVTSMCRFLLNYMNTLEEQMSDSENPNKWIPVSERLPKNGELVLFSTKTDRVFEGRFFVDKTELQWYAFRDKAFAYNNVVTAWLPLPEPYKEEKERKE